MASVMSHILTPLQGCRGPPYCHQQVLFKLENENEAWQVLYLHNGHSGFHVGAILSHTIEVWDKTQSIKDIKRREGLCPEHMS